MLQPTLDEKLCRTTDRDSSDGLDRLINPTLLSCDTFAGFS